MLQSIKPFHLLLLLWFILSNCQLNSDLSWKVTRNIEKRIEYGINPSIAIGIVDKNGSRFYNFGKVSKDGKEVDEHSVYEIGSITKVFTGILLAKQVIEEKAKLDDPIKDYLPIEIEGPVVWHTGEITLGSLSDHTSGLPRMPDNSRPTNWKNPFTDYKLDQMYSFISSYSPRYITGKRYEYSNIGQGLLGHILSLNVGLPYESLMIKDIAIPLGMSETKIELDQKMIANLTIGHSAGFEAENVDMPTIAGAGAIRSSTSDLIKFLSANLGLRETSLKPAMYMTHKVRHNITPNQKVGLGWHILKGINGDVTFHGGTTGGYWSFIGFAKESGKGVVVLANSQSDITDIGLHLLDSDFDLQEIKPSLEITLKHIIDTQGIESAKVFFEKMNKKKLQNYNHTVLKMNMLGLYYMDQGLDMTLEIFRMNMKLYPKSFIGYSSYAYVLAKKGQKDLAIEYYKKSLAINPDNQEDKRALEELENE